MIRKLRLSFIVAFLLLFLAIISVAPPQVQAVTTYTLIATTNEFTYVLPGFSLQYEDRDNDGKFSLDELVPGSFMGMQTVNWDDGTLMPAWVAGVPDEGLYLDGGGWHSSPNAWCFMRYVWFLGAPQFEIWSDVNIASYDYSRVGGEAPLPPSAYLLGVGLLGLMGWRRFEKY